MDATGDVWAALQGPWRAGAEAQVGPGEVVLAAFAPDLDERLRYVEAAVVLTDRRVISGDRGETSGGPGPRGWRSWALDEVAALDLKERNGLGSAELLGPAGALLARWRFTAARAEPARKFARRFEALRRGEPEADRPAACRSCGAPAGPTGLCPACAAEESPAPPSQAAPALRRLIRFARPRAGAIAVGFFLTVASTAAGLVPPYLTQPLVDDVLIPRQERGVGDLGAVRWYLGAMAAASALAWLLAWARSYVMAWASERISADLRDRTYDHLMRLSLEFFGGKRTGDLMARIGSDTDRICNFLSVNLVDFATDVLMIAGTAAILFFKAPLLAAVTLCPIPLAGLLVHRVRKRMRHEFHRASRVWGIMTSVLADTIPGIRVVKAFAQEAREVDRFRRANDQVLKVNDRVNTTWAFFAPTLALLTQLGLLVVWAVGAWMVFARGFQVGLLTMFLAYLGRFYTRLEAMSRMVQATQRAGASAARIFEILDRVPSVAEPPRPARLGPLRGAIEMDGVSFRYGHREVLREIDLRIAPGEMIGLVGPSGSGKSTLVNLVCRFYDVSGGAIRVDGIDVRQFPVEDYRRHIGLVLQEPFLFYGTIAENVAYGRPDASRAEVVAAASAARAHEFILRLPDGYDSMVGERGQSLSGGERQRISIARALLIDPAILILDEATSSVDTETEREIQEALENLIRGRTTIAIAHRLSTLRRADRLVVLERGRVVEVGRHHDLLRRRGAYARLHRAQQELAQGLAEGAIAGR